MPGTASDGRRSCHAALEPSLCVPPTPTAAYLRGKVLG